MLTMESWVIISEKRESSAEPYPQWIMESWWFERGRLQKRVQVMHNKQGWRSINAAISVEH